MPPSPRQRTPVFRPLASRRPHSRFVSRRCRVADGDPTSSVHQERAAHVSGRNAAVTSATHAGIPPARPRRPGGAVPGHHGPPVRPAGTPERPRSPFVSRRRRVPDGDPTSSAHRTRRPPARAGEMPRSPRQRTPAFRPLARDGPEARCPAATGLPSDPRARPDASLALREQKMSGTRRRPDIFCSPNAPPARAGEMAWSPRQRTLAFRPLATRRPGGAVPGRHGPPVRPAVTPGRTRARWRGCCARRRGHFARSRSARGARGARATREQKTPGREGRPGVFCSLGERARQWNCGTMR